MNYWLEARQERLYRKALDFLLSGHDIDLVLAWLLRHGIPQADLDLTEADKDAIRKKYGIRRNRKTTFKPTLL